MEKINVDNTKELTVVEWFTGYGGNELGLRRVLPTMRPIAFCERDAFVVANLVSKMEKGLLDAVPIWTDVTTFPIEPFQDRVGLFVASYPCQPFSHAGKRNGKDDDRHLWPSCRRFICGAHPTLVFLENVEGHISLGLSTVLSDLEEDGYTATWGIFSAAEVGAPHQRKRVFIMAHRHSVGQWEEGVQNGNDRWGIPGKTLKQSEQSILWSATVGCGELRDEELAHRQRTGLQGHAGDVNRQGGEPTGADRPAAEGGVSMGNTTSIGLCGGTENGFGQPTEVPGPRYEAIWPSRPGEAQYGWEPPRVVEDSQRIGRAGRASRPAGNDGRGPDGETALPGGGRGDRPADHGEIEQPVGRDAYGNTPGLDFARLSGLGDTELAEIREWMVKGTNRTDELRMCGNGVCPPTAERAFRVLYEELRNK
jgi:site-specific DNA-cytosine methylase